MKKRSKAVRAAMISTLTAMFLPALAPAQEPTFTVEVLDTRILIEPRVDDLKVAELSGLAFDEVSGKLYAVSDRSRLFAFDLDLTDERIAVLEPVMGRSLTDADGRAMRDFGFNPEDITRFDANTFIIVSEVGPRIARFTSQGTWLADVDVPHGVSDASLQRSEKDGLESLALHPTLGLLTVPEEPLAGEPRMIHTIHAQTGRALAFDTSATGSTSIKALNVLPDGRLLILERDRAQDDSLLAFLRVLDPATCRETGTCATDVAQVVLPDINDADFEGLTRVGDGLFLIVSDDKIHREDRSVFALLRIMLPPAS